MRHFFLCALAFAAVTVGSSQSAVVSTLFSKSKAPAVVATRVAEDTRGLRLNADEFQSVHDHRPGSMTLEFDLPGVGLAQVEMNQFCNLSSDFTIARTTAEGTREEHYVPQLVTYEVMAATTPRGRTEDVQERSCSSKTTCRRPCTSLDRSGRFALRRAKHT